MSFFLKLIYTVWFCLSLVFAALFRSQADAFLPYFIVNMLVMGVPNLCFRRFILKQAREKDPQNYDSIRLSLMYLAHPEDFHSNRSEVQQLIDEYKSMGSYGWADIILVISVGIICNIG